MNPRKHHGNAKMILKTFSKIPQRDISFLVSKNRMGLCMTLIRNVEENDGHQQDPRRKKKKKSIVGHSTDAHRNLFDKRKKICPALSNEMISFVGCLES